MLPLDFAIPEVPQPGSALFTPGGAVRLYVCAVCASDSLAPRVHQAKFESWQAASFGVGIG